MNKRIYEIIEALVISPKISRLVVYSNAMVPINDDKINILKNKRVVLSLTDYGDLAKHTPVNLIKLKSSGVTFRIHPPENWTDSGVIHDFNRTTEENQKLFENCCGKNLLTLSNGRLYRCPFAANADRLGALPENPKNYVNASAGKDVIFEYTRKISYLPACNFCKGRSFDAPQIVPAIQAKKTLSYRSYKLTREES